MAMTPELRALAICLTFPIRNTDGEAKALEEMIGEQIRQAILQEREACASIAEDGESPQSIAMAIRHQTRFLKGSSAAGNCPEGQI